MSFREENAQNLPQGYRGMLYESESSEKNVAEGIDRLVSEDDSYTDYNNKKRECSLKEKNLHNQAGSAKKGLHRLIEGLTDGDFQAEDILISAMIILMLNSTSEDDILMVLVLMMLL